MGSYTAIIRCKKCGRELARVEAYHEPDPLIFVPQDIRMDEYGLDSIFCQVCLNKRLEV